MATTEHSGIHCAECDVEKGRENHWLVIMDGDVFRAVAFSEFEGGLFSEHVVPVCGGECANKRWARWLGKFFGMKHVNPLPEVPARAPEIVNS